MLFKAKGINSEFHFGDKVNISTKTFRKNQLGTIIFMVAIGLVGPKILYLAQHNDKQLILNYKNKNKLSKKYQLSGVLTGLKPGNTLIIANRQEKVHLSLNGEFLFRQRIENSNDYYVYIIKQPTNQLCQVSNGFHQGGDLRSDVSSIRIICRSTS